MYITYENYKSLGGKSPLEDFKMYEMHARSIIDYYTFKRIKVVTDEVKACMVELIEFCYYIDLANRGELKGEVLSETVGKHTVQYSSYFKNLGIGVDGKMTSGISREHLEYKIVAKHLMRTGLMYRGINYDE